MSSLRTTATCLAFALLMSTPALAADNQAAPATTGPARAAASMADAALQGTVVETMNAAGYTYLQVESAAGKTWVAIPESTVTKGQQVACLVPHLGGLVEESVAKGLALGLAEHGVAAGAREHGGIGMEIGRDGHRARRHARGAAWLGA